MKTLPTPGTRPGQICRRDGPEVSPRRELGGKKLVQLEWPSWLPLTLITFPRVGSSAMSMHLSSRGLIHWWSLSQFR